MALVKRLTRLSPLITVPLAVVVLPVVMYTGALGGSIILWRLLVACLVAVAVIALPFVYSRWRGENASRPAAGGLAASALICVLVAAWWATHSPSLEREWSEPASRTPWAKIEGSLVTIHDVRDFRYQEDGTWEANWYDATYDLEELEQSYFILTTFGGVAGVAHVMVSFRFGDDRYIILSVEIRREVGEEYDPIGGVFRQFELFYTAADERDALALRTHVHKDPTWVIPMNAGREKTAAFFLDMVERMTALHHEPAWYNTITSSCASNLVTHYEQVNDIRLPPDYRVLLPGFSEDLLDELGLLPDGIDVATARKMFQINDVASKLTMTDDFSRLIRHWE